MTDHITIDDHRVSGPSTPASPPSPIDAVLYAREFELLLQLGRAKGYLEQDDLMSVLRSVELSPDLIIDVVMRVRAEGIEFVDSPGDSGGDLTSVPPTTAVLDLGADSEGPANAIDHEKGVGVRENGSGSVGTAVLPADGGDTERASAATPGRPPARRANPTRSKDRASTRSPTGAPPDNGYVGSDRFAGPGADPVHTYLKEIGKVELLD
ncbi:MAG TPA: RNA polymerase sigma factor region1.1 domain-containing protein, partial [Acidimicrobiales bacterium]|nr:RNA polymerase sigma factor region1.1 domain-containing protein [Acidimicrobiales bacterium]